MEKELLDNHLLTLDCEFGRYFTPSQISAIKEVIRYGAWGDADQEYLLGLDAINKRIFSSPKYSYGYITNDVTAESEIYTNNKKWVVSLVITLFSFAGLLLFFILAILVYLYKELPTRKYKNWPLYKILFRK